MQFRRVVLAAIVCTFGAASGAHAQMPQREPTQVVISARGVDFNNPRAVADFDTRLRWAAIVACDSGDPKPLRVQSEDARCARASWEAAVKRLDQPLLSQRHGQAVALAANPEPVEQKR